MYYKHTQQSPMMKILCVAALIAGAAVLYALWIVNAASGGKIQDAVFISAAAFLVAGAIFYLFTSLTVEVDHEAVRISFGPGLIKKSFSLAEIDSAASVHNSWINGWGIHYTGNGWLYNVDGLEAVELRFKSGKKARIGTDEPAALETAIRERLASGNFK